MKHRLLILTTIVAVAAAVAFFVLRPSDGPPTLVEERPSSEVQSTPAQRAVNVPAMPVPQAESASSVSDARSISDEFKHAADYLDFANSLLERAKSGNADAQYYLYAALQYCDESYRAFFRKPKGGTRTLDEALNRVSTRPSESIDVVRAAYERCAQMFDGGSNALGTADSWLKLATKNEQPVALVITAKEMLLNPTQGVAPDAVVMNAERMLMKALRNGDPEAVWRIGEIQPMLSNDDSEDMLRQWAWMLAACQRGYDCQHSSWMEFNCRFDQLCAQDRNAVDFIRRATDLDFPEIESRAKTINTNIDAKAWDALERELTN